MVNKAGGLLFIFFGALKSSPQKCINGFCFYKVVHSPIPPFYHSLICTSIHPYAITCSHISLPFRTHTLTFKSCCISLYVATYLLSFRYSFSLPLNCLRPQIALSSVGKLFHIAPLMQNEDWPKRRFLGGVP